MESYGQSIVLRVFEQSRPLYDMLELFTGPAVYGWATGVRSASTAPSGASPIRREERPERALTERSLLLQPRRKRLGYGIAGQPAGSQAYGGEHDHGSRIPVWPYQKTFTQVLIDKRIE